MNTMEHLKLEYLREGRRMNIVKKIVRYEIEELPNNIAEQVEQKRIEILTDGSKFSEDFYFFSANEQCEYAYCELFGTPDFSFLSENEKIEGFKIIF